MRSKHADYFNHDQDAPEYDADVLNERDPIRTGYSCLMRRIAARVVPGDRVLDLGTGTGNTILALPTDTRITGIDVSAKMMEIARTKLRGREITFVQDDLLHYVTEHDLTEINAIVSAYVLHHLMPDERESLFSELNQRTGDDVRVIIGDLMYANLKDRASIVQKHRHDFPHLADVIDDEFFWDVEASAEMLRRTSWNAEWTRVSDLSWLVELTKK